MTQSVFLSFIDSASRLLSNLNDLAGQHAACEESICAFRSLEHL